MPPDLPRYAMGLGRPEEIVACVDMGYNLFDCVIPTREARHQRLYVFNPDGQTPEGQRRGGFYHFHYALDDRHISDRRPVDANCSCILCRRYSRAYLHHLFKTGDAQAQRLATAHNLRFFARLMNYYELSLCATALGGATAPSAPRSRPLPHLRASADGGSKGGPSPLGGGPGARVPGGGPGAAPPALSQQPPHRIPELHRILATLRSPASRSPVPPVT